MKPDLKEEKKLWKKGFRLVAGLDEVGRGPLAGPVVASAVILKDFKFKNRIADSKVLSAAARQIAYEEILDKAYIGVGIVGEKIIDEINILRATHRAMELAVLDLGVRPDYLLIDGNSSPDFPYPRLTIVDGDSRSISVACASIVAKVTRDLIMFYYDRLYPAYGFSKHKGYGTKDHLSAIKKYGPVAIHRFTFSPIKQVNE